MVRLQEPISPWVHISNVSPLSEMKKGREEFLERISRTKAATVKHKDKTLAPIIALVTLVAVSLQLNVMLMMWKIQQAKHDDPTPVAKFKYSNNNQENILY